MEGEEAHLVLVPAWDGPPRANANGKGKGKGREGKGRGEGRGDGVLAAMVASILRHLSPTDDDVRPACEAITADLEKPAQAPKEGGGKAAAPGGVGGVGGAAADAIAEGLGALGLGAAKEPAISAQHSPGLA